MCTAISYKTKDHYFGRTLDLEYSNNEEIVITPRNHPLSFRHVNGLETHYAMIGTACIANGYPLYYEASNEKGLSIAGLNFPGNAAYLSYQQGRYNLASFELIPWLLGQCADLSAARTLLEQTVITNDSFSGELPNSPLHWFLADPNGSIVAEPMNNGLQLHNNPVGTLTNNPPFSYHLTNLSNYLNITSAPPVNRFSRGFKPDIYSRGMGGIGLPGDFSSASRFVRAAFVKMNSVSGESETESVHQFFHILGSVNQPRGCVQLEDGRYVTTIYTSCCNTVRGVFYYKTYNNNEIYYIDMHRENLDDHRLVRYPFAQESCFHPQN